MRYRFILYLAAISLVVFFTAAVSPAHDIEDGIQAFQNHNLKKAHEIFLGLANEECMDAMWLLGMMYYKGIGVPEDYEQAFTWFENASGLGDPDSMNFIGYMYESGIGVERNLDQAVRWYEKAVESGSVEAMYNLSILNMKLKNDVSSYMWYKLAEHYKYECSDDERKVFRDKFRYFLRKDQIMAAQALADMWIQKHSGYNALLKRLRETGPVCYPFVSETEPLPQNSRKAK